MKKFICLILIFLFLISVSNAEIHSQYFRETKPVYFEAVGLVSIIDEETNIFESGQIDLFVDYIPENLIAIFLYGGSNYAAFGVWDITQYGVHVRFWQEDLRDFDSLDNLTLVFVTN